jgi:hypothetical protein
MISNYLINNFDRLRVHQELMICRKNNSKKEGILAMENQFKE